MSDHPSAARAYLEVLFADRPREIIPIFELPFFIGRGSEHGNHLDLDDLRISRNSATISVTPDGFRIEDRGQRGGIFVNGELLRETQILSDGDRVRLGTDDGCQLAFRSTELRPSDGGRTRLRSLVDSGSGDSNFELNRLTLLLQATSLLHSQLPLTSIFAAMLDHAIAITRADRGMLLEPDASSVLQVKVARGRDQESLAPETMTPSRTVLQQAIEQRSPVVNADLRLADLNVQAAQSVVLQFLRSAVVIPLYGMSRGALAQENCREELLGAVYLDSRREAAFSVLDRQILDALATQAVSILDNARLMQHERERQRLEQELSIAGQIQQALVPHGLQVHSRFAISGLHRPCDEVGGDYFDVFPLPDGRTAIFIADVAGKGLGAALLVPMLQGALSATSLGIEPVKLFEHLNRFLCDRSVVDRCVTMFGGILNPDGALEFVRAGHPSPLLLRKREVSELYLEGSFPIGLTKETSYVSSQIVLEPEDTLLLFTDGLTEAADQDRNLFGLTRLMDAFVRHSDSSLDALQSGILAEVEQFTRCARPRDDITLLAVRYR
jgi:serine phosphatase RsbU (regulator of sigma subunit)